MFFTTSRHLRKQRNGLHATANPRQPSLEPLEDRRLLANYNGSVGVIADNGLTEFTLNVPYLMIIGDINVELDIAHTRDSDLDVYLKGPNGTRVQLFTDVGGSGDHFTGTTLDDEAPSSIIQGSSPFSGSFQPEGSLNSFDGVDAQGVWTLEIADDRRRQTGVLTGWSIDLTPLATNDPIYPDQWYLHNEGQSGGVVDADIDAPEAWQVTTGSMSTVVAVLDTGVYYDHEDVYLNIWLNEGEIPAAIRPILADTDGDGIITFRDLNEAANQPFVTDLNATGYIDAGDLLSDPAWENGSDDDGNGFIDDLVGWDFLDNDNDPTQSTPGCHGTLTAGMIGASTNNGVGVAGVNWNVRIMPLRHKDEGVISNVNLLGPAIASLNYAVENGASISRYGGAWFEDAESPMYDAIKAAGDSNHLFIAAAGNSSVDNDVDNPNRIYPSSYDLDNIISVAAVDRYNELASFSSYGPTSVDLAAPSPGNWQTCGDPEHDNPDISPGWGAGPWYHFSWRHLVCHGPGRRRSSVATDTPSGMVECPDQDADSRNR